MTRTRYPCALLLFVLVSWSSLDPPTAQASTKKGLCVGPSNFLCDDFKVWHNVNWWYDWTMDFHALRHQTHCTNFSTGFVPMIRSWVHHTDSSIAFPADTKYVLGFNEPNIYVTGNLTARQAASHWHAIQRRAHGRKLVSPAVAWCSKTFQCNANATEWFDEFFKLCHGCRVDYLATHVYTCSADEVMQLLELLWKRYHKKIWLTEFACPHAHSEHKQLQYMKAILPRLEAADFVYRYSWFTSRQVVSRFSFVLPDASLLMANESRLTPLGHYYNNFKHGPPHPAVG